MKTNIGSRPIYDAVGIGIGPFNLGMAALAEGTGLDCLFFEQKSEFQWHEGMLIEGTTLQVPFLADLVTMANPKNKYSFLSYLQQHERLYHFYFFEKFHIPRNEYNHYCRWAAEQLESCKFSMKVEDVLPFGSEEGFLYEVYVRNEKSGEVETYLARHLVLGIGTKPQLPAFVKQHEGKRLFHSAEYLKKKEECLNARSLTVIGSGQSAAEIFLDLAREVDSNTCRLNWLTRSKGFFPMEYSKLGLEYFSPDYIDFFYHLPQEKKDTLLTQQDLLYKGISAETIGDIYDLMYEKSAGNKTPDFFLQSMTEVTGLQQTGSTPSLHCRHWMTEETFELESEVIIFATGYKPAVPSFLASLEEYIDWDEQGRFQIERDYRLKTHLMTANEIFVQNGEMHTHGVGAPDLGLGAHRNAVILNTMARETLYPLSKKNVFQCFQGEERWVPLTR
ncbi:lysine N(6)-hydroxylase/L-ornithine N(5)-oxygenase family protein [Fictibacillus terranigra]|uniref:L-lysine N6-monooxygenase MbtG n=1 Tax=Fictibacillus terranigra TaxID=3058424 RepID=A0ABT8E7V6_9BACL|nr:lysine N(6)-hydroxylase/L-ornithine N(5)-oxygenase family protein [Fictibacillus sp. CENA-BCM004]MDN4073974.1 lysine N(6)-hydroxylase/L-ornithine N(5)-oxygenase family protein [Fictibacillus sp. CENA-BCM004]